MVYKYHSIICAGTFSPLHDGHKFLLRFAFSLGKKVYVTITSDAYTLEHKPQALPFATRKAQVEAFLQTEQLLERAEIVPIDDVYGITLDVSLPLEALLVTDETLSGGLMVNKKREELHLLPLFLEVVKRKEGEVGLPISSTLLRSGIIDEKGNLTMKEEIIDTISFLPLTLRKNLQEPIGRIILEKELTQFDDSTLIAVGDVTTKKLHEAGCIPALSVVDFVVERHIQQHSLGSLGFTGEEEVLQVDNPPGTITPTLWQSVKKALVDMPQKKVVIVVNGEEDLAVIPIVLLCPIGYTVCYGQPQQGLVAVDITQDKKMQILKLFDAFQQNNTRGH